MARTVDGYSSCLRAARTISRVTGKYGTARMAARSSTQFAAACLALVAALQALGEADDIVGEVDRRSPLGPGDLTGPLG